MSKLDLCIIGAGIGGMAATVALRQAGFDVEVYEQAQQFTRIGSGIMVLPNACTALRGLEVLERLEASSFRPYSLLNREWNSGQFKRELPMPTTLYGAPFLCMHRADLHEALCQSVPRDVIHFNKKLVGLEQLGSRVELTFEDGTQTLADGVIAADGVHSRVRDLIIGPDKPVHKGRIAYRSVFDSALLKGRDIGSSMTKWWGPDRHIVIYYTKADRSQIYFVTSVPESAEWITEESWSAQGDIKELRDAYAGFHEDVQIVLSACPSCHKWAILERDPLPKWSSGQVVLLGDACHPMTPYMAQGAATAIEDAAVLTRCISDIGGDDLETAFRTYEEHRKPRTSRIQAISSANTWMNGGNDDASWLYGYNAWEALLR